MPLAGQCVTRVLLAAALLGGCDRRKPADPTLPDAPIVAVDVPPPSLRLDTGRMFADLEQLADDALLGRHSGDPVAIGAAANILAKAHREAGLAPIGGTYLRPFSLVVGKDADASHYLWIERDGESIPADAGAFVSIAFGEARIAVGEAVFAGRAPTGKGVRDRIALMLAAERGAVPWTPESLKTRLQTLASAGATGVVVVGGPDEPLPEQAELAAALQDVALTTVFIHWDVVQSLTIGGKSLAAAAAKLADRSPKTARPIEGAKISLARRSRPRLAEVPNVLATLRGGDLAHEIVVLGAHYDHIGTEGRGVFCRDPSDADDEADEICNGADDNASGTAMVLAVARAMAEAHYKPRRSIVFAHFAGEELGLHGSAALVKDLPEAAPFGQGKMVAMVNLDMVGRLGERGLEIGGAATSSAWRPLLERIQPADLHVLLTPTVSPRSDHANFHKAGVPVLFFFTGLHDDYHRTSDELPLINRPGMATIGDMVLALMQALGDGEPVSPARAPRATRPTRGTPR